MTLASGSAFGPYEVVAQLGAGGMGVVYRARDRRLGRDVALKVLSDAIVDDPSRAARFEREARTLATLSHQNIAGIHGIETDLGSTALVLELVEGPTLADRLFEGPLSITQALDIARQIALGLQAAHDVGIVHRDLKPANIKLRPDGTVKILDFGIAKVMGDARHHAATITDLHTAAGAIIGTPAYMSPEQARGGTVDRQADIWSFGVILYELLTGQSPFRRPTIADTLASVVQAEPDLTTLPSGVPPSIRRLVRRCLEKERAQRLRDIGDARLDLEDAREAIASGSQSDAIGAAVTPAVSRARRWRRVAVAALVGLAGVAGWALARQTASAPRDQMAWLALTLGGRPGPDLYGARYVAVSEDGARVALSAGDRLWIRRIDHPVPVSVETMSNNPFFSPDGEWVAYFSQSGEASGLRKIPSAGGAPVLIAATADRPAGGTWRSDGTIVYATSAGLFQVSDTGGEPVSLVRPDASKKERLYAWPRFTPDGQSVLFTILTDAIESAAIARLRLDTRAIDVLFTGGTAPQILPDGRLLYARDQRLMTVPVDPGTLRTRGEAVAAADFEVAISADNGAAQFAVSRTGTLVFLSPMELAAAPSTLLRADRQGREEVIGQVPPESTYPRVSPDGARIAIDVPGDNRDIWIWHTRRASLVRLTNGPTEDVLPMWSPDGSRVYFSSDRAGNFDVYSQAADGATDARVEYTGPGAQLMSSLTPDGTAVLLVEDYKDIGLLTLTSPPRLEGLRRTPNGDWLAEVSPNGKWVAYESDETGGRMEVFLRPFPDVNGRREQVSKNGGRFPRWNPRNPNELFFVDPDGGMQAVNVTFSPDVSLGAPVKLFDFRPTPPRVSGRPYDVSPVDGRFVFIRPAVPGSDRPTTLSVVLHWLGNPAGSR